MKGLSIFMAVIIAAAFSSPAFCAGLDAEEVSKGIVGEWRLLAFERGGKLMADYSKDNVIWRFGADGTAFISDKQLGEFTDSYKVLKSTFGWMGKGGILILIKELKNPGFSHPKFMVRSMTPGGELLLGDWDDTLVYRLVRVK